MGVLSLLSPFFIFSHVEGLFCSIAQKYIRKTSSSLSHDFHSCPEQERLLILLCLEGMNWACLVATLMLIFFWFTFAHRTQALSCFLLSDLQGQRGPVDWVSGLYISVNYQEAIVNTYTNHATFQYTVSAVELTHLTASVWLLCCLSVDSKFGSR